MTTIELADIPRPHGWRDRLASESVAILTESIREVGLIHVPVLQRGTLEIIAGADRIAACERLGHRQIDVEWMVLSDDQIEIVRATENAIRRQDGAFWLARLASAREAAIEREREASPPAETPTLTPKQEAHREAAKLAGVSEKTVQRAIAASRSETPAPTKKAKIEPVKTERPIIETWNIPGADDFLPAASRAMAALDEAGRCLRNASAALRPLLDDRQLPAQTCEQIREALKMAAYMVRSSRPAAVCPYCRIDEEKRRRCQFCDSLGFVGVAALEQTPIALKVAEVEEAF